MKIRNISISDRPGHVPMKNLPVVLEEPASMKLISHARAGNGNSGEGKNELMPTARGILPLLSTDIHPRGFGYQDKVA
jgi:hypothetical protein